MKKIALLIAVVLISSQAFSQAQEAQQLLLNWEKLTQLKKILNDMYAGYKIVYKGYTTIKDISEGNFNLHKDFLDGLLQVSPTVRKYKRVSDIIKSSKNTKQLLINSGKIKISLPKKLTTWARFIVTYSTKA